MSSFKPKEKGYPAFVKDFDICENPELFKIFLNYGEIISNHPVHDDSELLGSLISYSTPEERKNAVIGMNGENFKNKILQVLEEELRSSDEEGTIKKRNSPYASVQKQLTRINNCPPVLQRRITNAMHKSFKNQKKFVDNEKNAKPSDVWSYMTFIFKIILGFVMLLLVYQLYNYSTSRSFSNLHSYVNINDFKNNIKRMKDIFPNQDEWVWLRLDKNGLNHLNRVYNEDHTDIKPFSILISGYNGSALTMQCFLKHLSRSFTSMKYSTVQCSHRLSKFDLEESIKQGLEKKQKYIVIKNLEKLSYDKASLFMSYADEFAHSAAVSFPQSAIIFTSHMTFDYNKEIDRKSDESRVRSYFMEDLWNDSLDNKAALWTRVGNIVVLLRPEDEHAMKSCIQDE